MKLLIRRVAEVVLTATGIVITVGLSHLAAPSFVSALSAVNLNHPESPSISYVFIDALLDDDEQPVSINVFLPQLFR